LETKLQQLPKEGSGGTIGLVLIILGVLLFLVGASGSGELAPGGIFLGVIGIIWWISGKSSKSNRKKAINETTTEILKLKNQIIEIEHIWYAQNINDNYISVSI